MSKVLISLSCRSMAPEGPFQTIDRLKDLCRAYRLLTVVFGLCCFGTVNRHKAPELFPLCLFIRVVISFLIFFFYLLVSEMTDPIKKHRSFLWAPSSNLLFSAPKWKDGKDEHKDKQPSDRRYDLCALSFPEIACD